MQSGDRVGHFEVLEPLGAGGMGQVWRARDTRLKRDVALKVLPDALASDAQAMARFRREAELMAAVQDPNIAAIYSIEKAEAGGVELQVLVLELVEGETLAERLRQGPLPVSEALEVGARVARALQAAHESGVVHRDLKPANVMLGTGRRVKVLDFGIAKTSATPTEALTLADLSETPTLLDATVTGALVGTAPYMSPEQVRGRDVDSRADVWALGCLLYEMLTGSRAFSGATPGEVLAAVVADEPDWERLPVPVPEAVRAMLRSCLRKAAADRTWTAAEARRTLEAALGGDTSTSVAPSRPGSSAFARRFAAVAIVIVVLAAGLWLLREFEAFDADRGAQLSLEQVTSIVALPSALEDGPDELFGGTHEAITNRMAGLPGLLVKEPPSEIEIARLGGELSLVAEQYRVDAVVTSVAKRGPDGVLLRVRVIDPDTGGLLWGQDYANQESSPEMLIQEAAMGVRAALRSAPATDPALVLAASSSEERLAQAQLDVGKTYSRRDNNAHQEEDYERANRALERALSLAPGLAEAAAELAMLAQYRIESGDDSAVDDLGQWAELAVSLDPDSGAAWAAQSLWDLYRTGSPMVPLRAAMRGAALAPDKALPNFEVGLFLAQVTTDLGVVAMRRAADLDPLHLYYRIGVATLLLDRGQLSADAILPHILYSLRMQPDNVSFAMTLGLARLRQGDAVGLEEAVAIVRANAVAFMPGETSAFEALVRLHAATMDGDDDGVQQQVAVLHGLAPELTVTMGQDIVLEAIAVLARAGRVAEAELLLGTCLNNPQLMMPWDIYSERPDLEPLRNTETMQQVAAVARTNLEAAMQVIEEARTAGELADYLTRPYLDLRDRLAMPRQE